MSVDDVGIIVVKLALVCIGIMGVAFTAMVTKWLYLTMIGLV